MNAGGEENRPPLFSMQEQSGGRLPLVSSYGPGRFAIGGKWIAGPVLIWPEGWTSLEVQSLDAITQDVVRPLTSAQPPLDILLVGTGASMTPIPEQFRKLCRDLDLSIDPMDSAAAARTLNVLLMEDRRVSAILLPI